MKKILFALLFLLSWNLSAQKIIKSTGFDSLTIKTADSTDWYQARGVVTITVQLVTTKAYLKLVCEGTITPSSSTIRPYPIGWGSKNTGIARDTITLAGSMNNAYQLTTNDEEAVRFRCISYDSGSVKVIFRGRNAPSNPLGFTPLNATVTVGSAVAVNNFPSTYNIGDTTDFVNHEYADSNTVSSTNADTLSRLIISVSNSLDSVFDTWYKGWIAAEGEGIIISTSASFPANNRRILKAGEVYYFSKRRTALFTNIYIKSRDGSSTVTYRWELSGD